MQCELRSRNTLKKEKKEEEEEREKKKYIGHTQREKKSSKAIAITSTTLHSHHDIRNIDNSYIVSCTHKIYRDSFMVFVWQEKIIKPRGE